MSANKYSIIGILVLLLFIPHSNTNLDYKNGKLYSTNFENPWKLYNKDSSGTNNSRYESSVTHLTNKSIQNTPGNDDVLTNNQRNNEKALFKILYNNDLSNITWGYGDWRNPKTVITKDSLSKRLKRSVIEVAPHGVDVHILKIGNGLIPIWKSQFYPAKDHYEKWELSTGKTSSVWGQYMKDTTKYGDLLKAYIESCNSIDNTTRPKIFVSMRLNDTHYMIDRMMLELDKNTTKDWHPYTEWISDYIIDNRHKDAFFIHDLSKKNDYRSGLNWAFNDEDTGVLSPPELKLKFIEEICRNYKIDGLELDFMRFDHYFRLNETSYLQRKSIVTDFITSVREILNSADIEWLSVRIPIYKSMHSKLGIDISSFDDLGINMVVLSTSFWTMQQGVLDDLEDIRKQIPHTSLYMELHYSTFWDVEAKGNERVPVYEEQLYTTANLAYDKEIDGVSLFNYKYMQNWTGKNRIELAFNYIDSLDNPSWLSNQKVQWYFRSLEWHDEKLPFNFHNSGTTFYDTLITKFVDPSYHPSGNIRMFFKQEYATYESVYDIYNGRKWQVKLNGHTLQRSGNCNLNPTNSIYRKDVHFPRGGVDYSDPDTLVQRMICYEVDSGIINNRNNFLSIKQLEDGGDPRDANLYYYDLIIPGE